MLSDTACACERLVLWLCFIEEELDKLALVDVEVECLILVESEVLVDVDRLVDIDSDVLVDVDVLVE